MTQDDFQLEWKVHTKYWSIKVDTKILGMDYVDTYYIGKACEWGYDRNTSYFYCNITEEMIDNGQTERRTLINQARQPIKHPGYIRKMVHHYTPTKKRGKEIYQMA